MTCVQRFLKYTCPEKLQLFWTVAMLYVFLLICWKKRMGKRKTEKEVGRGKDKCLGLRILQKKNKMNKTLQLRNLGRHKSEWDFGFKSPMSGDELLNLACTWKLYYYISTNVTTLISYFTCRSNISLCLLLIVVLFYITYEFIMFIIVYI